jgi:hypothetical protein
MNIPKSLEAYEFEVLGEAIYFPFMDNKNYHEGPGLSSSKIRRFGVSQLHALEEEMEDSSALRFGTAAHALVVEGETTFNNEIACLSGSPYTRANKEARAEFEARGLTVISTEDRQKIFAMNEALIPEAKKMLQPSSNEYPPQFNFPYERAIYWWEGETFLKVKADVVRYPLQGVYSQNRIILVDYKTTTDCSLRGFTNSIRKYQYDLQAAWYKQGFERAGFEVQDFFFVAQEKKPPYASKIFKMKAADLERGWLELERLLGEYNAVKNGKEASVYNTPDLVEVELNK